MSETPTPASPSVSSAGGISTVDFGDFAVSSNSESTDQIIESDKSDREAAEKIKEAARELGKRGGEVTAARKALKPTKAFDRSEVSDDAEAEEETEAPVQAKTGKPDEKPLGKPRDDPKARMLEATRQAAELKRALAERDRKIAELSQARPAAPVQAKPKEALTYADDPNIEPNSENYTEWEKFSNDHTRWAVRQELSIYAQQQAAASRNAQIQQIRDEQDAEVAASFKNYTDKLESAWPDEASFKAEINPDLISWETSEEAKMHDGPNAKIGATHCIADEIIALDDPVPVMRYLSKHPEELQRIAALTSSRKVAREMAKIEDRASAAITASALRAEVSKAPKPVRPVTGGPHAAVDEMSDDMDFDSYVKVANARERKSARR